MIAFEVVVNGERSCIAGVEGLGVISAILSWVNREQSPDQEDNELYVSQELTLEVEGIQNSKESSGGQHVSWLSRALQVGDTVTIQIKKLDSVDEPVFDRPEDSDEVVREAKRHYYEELKKQYGD